MRDNMEVVMKKTKEELVRWWDKCYYSPEQRKQFPYFEDGMFTVYSCFMTLNQGYSYLSNGFNIVQQFMHYM